MINKKRIKIGAGILIAIAIAIMYLSYEPEIDDNIFSGQYENSNELMNSYIYVDIKGEIKNPGVYKLEIGSRVFQLVSMAGGYKEDADTNTLNLSKFLKDEQVIYIPSFMEQYPIIKGDDSNTEGETKIDINNAPMAMLETLPGVGPSTAKAIIDYIEENSYFNSIEEIKNVPGIGDSTFEAIKDLIRTD